MQAPDRLTDLLHVLVELETELTGLLAGDWQELQERLIAHLRELEANPEQRQSVYTEVVLLLRQFPAAHGRVMQELGRASTSDHRDRSGFVDVINQFLYPASTRYTDVDYPARVSVDRWRFPVVVILRQQPSLDTAESAALDVRSGILVSVAVSALDFEIVGPFHQSISVPRDADSTPAVFYLRPLAVGRAHFTLEFVQSGQHLGTIVGEIDVVAADENGAMNNSIMQAVEISAIPSEPTLILAIDHGWENGQHILTFSLFSDDTKQRFDKVVLQADPSIEAERLFEQLRQLNLGVDPTSQTELAVALMLSKEQIEAQVKAIGHQLWQSYLPQQFKALYREKRQRWRDQQLLIVSDEPYIPWELVWPYDVDGTWEDPEPWCMTFRLCRWLRRNERGGGHAHSPNTLAIRRGVCLAPSDSGLPAAQTECAVFKNVLQRLAADDTSPDVASRDAVVRLLENGDYDWIHAATHGTFSTAHPAVDSAIWLEDGYPLTPQYMRGAAIQGYIHRSRPGFVFNVCHGARQSWTVSGLGGWANHLISSGASIFIAPMWPLNDDDALEFARTFYAALCNRKSVGDALRLSREQLRDSGTTAWLAYAAYGNPGARLAP